MFFGELEPGDCARIGAGDDTTAASTKSKRQTRFFRDVNEKLRMADIVAPLFRLLPSSVSVLRDC